MKKIIVHLTIAVFLGASISPCFAKEGGAYLYSQKDLDISIPLSEKISNQSTQSTFKRITYQEVNVKSETNDSTIRTIFTVERNNGSEKVVAFRPVVARID